MEESSCFFILVLFDLILSEDKMGRYDAVR